VVQRRSASILRLLRVLLAVGIIAVIAWRLAEQWEGRPLPALVGSPVPLLVATLCGAAALLGLALLYAALLRLTGHLAPGSLPWALRTWLQGYFYRYIPGKLMLVVERARLAEQAGVGRTTSVVLVLWETLLLLAGACVVAGLAASGLPAAAGVPTGLVRAVGVAALSGALLFGPILRFLSRHSAWLSARLPPAVLVVPAGWQALLVLGYGAVWLLLGASFTFTCRAFTSGAGAGLDTAVLYVVGYVLGLVVGVTPAGLGLREGLVAAGLASRFPAEASLVFVLASRALMTVVELVLVGLSLLVPPPGRGGRGEGAAGAGDRGA